MKSAHNLLRALTRAMLANPELEPMISIEKMGGTNHVEIDVRPFDPAPLIGSGGTMKFAIQQLLAGNDHPASWSIAFRSTGRLSSPKLRDIKPQVEPMQTVIDAAVNHWRALGLIASNKKVETSETVVVGILVMEETLGNAQRGSFSRIARAIGKANGYRGTCIIEKPALARG